MAKKKVQKVKEAPIREIDLLTDSKDNMKIYGTLTIEERSIPDFRDGCKPVQRRILWAGHALGYNSNRNTVKTAKWVADTMGAYHPHGDSAIYQAMMGMAKPNCTTPLVHGQGNTGGIDDGPAAMRYVEARLSVIAEKYLLDPDYLAVVPMVDNYDGTCKEPIYLPAKLPMSLLNPTFGIAVGVSTSLPSFSLDSVIALTKAALKKGKCTADMCQKTLEFAWPYGGEFCGTENDLKSFFKTGEGGLLFRPVVKQEKDTIVLKTMCPGLKPAQAEQAILTVPGVKDAEYVNSITNENWFVVSTNKTASKRERDLIVQDIRKKLTKSHPCRMYVTLRKEDETVEFRKTSVADVVNLWLDWRIDFEKKVIKRLVEIEDTAIQKIDWLMWAQSHLDDIIKALKSNDPDQYLIKKCKLSPEATSYILSQQVRRLSKLEADKLKEQKATRVAARKKLKSDASSKDNLVKRIISNL